MICLKIRTFVVSATTCIWISLIPPLLWFAWKFVPLWYQQQRKAHESRLFGSCDLLENSYLCGISNNVLALMLLVLAVVICLKIRTFVVSATTRVLIKLAAASCDLLENSYLCGISNNCYSCHLGFSRLWFAWKFVPLWYQQQPDPYIGANVDGCDLLENSYLCGISNNVYYNRIGLVALWFAWKFVPLWYQQQQDDITSMLASVVICLKIRTFVVSATTYHSLRESWK